MSKGGGSSKPTQQNVVQTNVPEYLRPYVERNVGMAEALINDALNNGYQVYDAPRIAEFSPLQQQAYQSASAMTPAWQTDLASLGTAGLSSAMAGLGYTPSSFTYQPITAGEMGYSSVSAPTMAGGSMQAATSNYDPWKDLEQFQMDGVGDVATNFWNDQYAEEYMSPYIQEVIDVQKREADRDAQIAAQQRAANLIGAGAYGGSRQAIMDAEAGRNLAILQGDIQKTGLQSAYEAAMSQFNQDMGRDLSAKQGNQQAALTVGTNNLQSLLQTQGLGAAGAMQIALANLNNQQQANVQNLAAKLQAQGVNAENAMRAAIANQQASITAGQANLQAQMEAAKANQLADMQAQQWAEASRQFGAGFGLDALSGAMAGLGQLGQLGSDAFAQNVDLTTLQNQLGVQQQAREQAMLDIAYQDFLNQQKYPYEQVAYMSDLLRGTPLASSYSTLTPAPNPYSQLGGTGLGAAALAQALE